MSAPRIQVGSRVYALDGSGRRGVVVQEELASGRFRVKWDGDKRTWFQGIRLALETTPPAPQAPSEGGPS